MANPVLSQTKCFQIHKRVFLSVKIVFVVKDEDCVSVRTHSTQKHTDGNNTSQPTLIIYTQVGYALHSQKDLQSYTTQKKHWLTLVKRKATIGICLWHKNISILRFILNNLTNSGQGP